MVHLEQVRCLCRGEGRSHYLKAKAIPSIRTNQENLELGAEN